MLVHIPFSFIRAQSYMQHTTIFPIAVIIYLVDVPTRRPTPIVCVCIYEPQKLYTQHIQYDQFLVYLYTFARELENRCPFVKGICLASA